MDYEILFRLLVLIGLAFNITGTFLIVFSIRFTGEVPIYAKNMRLEVPKFEKCMFRWGVSILATGFIFQFAGMLLELILN